MGGFGPHCPGGSSLNGVGVGASTVPIDNATSDVGHIVGHGGVVDFVAGTPVVVN